MAAFAHADTAARVTAKGLPAAVSRTPGHRRNVCVVLAITILTGALLYTGTAAAVPRHVQSFSTSVAIPSTIEPLGCCNDAGSGSATTTVPHLGNVDVSVDYAACGVVACRPGGENQLRIVLTARSGDTLTIVGRGEGGLAAGTGSWTVTDGSGRLARWKGSGTWAVGVKYVSPATGAGQAATLTVSLVGTLGQPA